MKRFLSMKEGAAQREWNTVDMGNAPGAGCARSGLENGDSLGWNVSFCAGNSSSPKLPCHKRNIPGCGNPGSNLRKATDTRGSLLLPESQNYVISHGKSLHSGHDWDGSTTVKKPDQPVKQSGPRLIREVAKRAGVSSSTVSRVTNGLSTVHPTLVKRVWAAIEELGYTPNPQARALVTGRSRTLGLLISEITNPFFPELIQNFEDIAAANDFEIMVGSTNYNRRRAEVFIRRLAHRRVEGVAVLTFRAECELLDELIGQNVPLVSIDEGIDAPRSLVLQVDYAAGIHQAVQHLALLGHRKLAYAGGPMPHLTNLLRKQGFIGALERIGLHPKEEWIYEGEHTFAGGSEAASKFLALKNRPTAIVCSNDLMAIGVLRVLSKHGINVPDKMSVVGFDDIQLAEFSTPSLTSVRMSREDLARCAFVGLTRLQNPNTAGDRTPIRIPTSLVVRESTSFYLPAARGLKLRSGDLRKM